MAWWNSYQTRATISIILFYADFEKRNSHNLTTKLDGLWVNTSTWFFHSILHKDKTIQHNMQKLQNQKLFWKEKSYNVPSRVSSSYINNLFSENKQNLTFANFIKYERGNIKLGISTNIKFVWHIPKRQYWIMEYHAELNFITIKTWKS